MEDPDLEIIRGGGGEPVLKIIFWALRASDWSDKKEGRAPPGPSPGSDTGLNGELLFVYWECDTGHRKDW